MVFGFLLASASASAHNQSRPTAMFNKGKTKINRPGKKSWIKSRYSKVPHKEPSILLYSDSDTDSDIEEDILFKSDGSYFRKKGELVSC